MKVITFLFILFILSNGSYADAQERLNKDLESTATCPSATLFSDITYEDLRSKLDNTLKEKNKSLIFLDFRGLQAQVDVLANHLVEQDRLTASEAKTILKKTIAHLETLEALLDKAKEAAQQIKENQVVPLATLTSLKSEADACNLVVSPYNDIFKTLSHLNKELSEILMISPQKITAQKEKAQSLLRKVSSSDEASAASNQDIAAHFNFMQKNIQFIVQTFEFDPRVLQVAKQ